MKLGYFPKKIVRKCVFLRNRVSESNLRNRNLRIVRRQPKNFRFFEEELSLPDPQMILQIARECFLREGCYPISFSNPRKFEEAQGSKSCAVSDTVPYVPYSYGSEVDYYANYSHAILAITQKKGGWDCFRHLEIIGAGSVPLFLQGEKIPEYTMIHYPKNSFRAIERNYTKNFLLPSEEFTTNLISYSNQTMTTEAMCRYFINLSGIDITPLDSILFVDSKLSSSADYLSVFNFIGLKQVYGDQVHSLYEEPDYVYADTTQDVSKLYGRGFGYTKVLSRSHVQQNSVASPKIVVISNLERDISLVESLKKFYPNSKFIMFWGGDRPIPRTIKEKVLVPQAILFCREIY